MENKRIRKLLRSEYPQLSRDAILVESPFAETTRDGRGLREVALGLTTSLLIVATDVFSREPNFRCPPGVDPSIETLQLVSITPLDCLTINVFRKKRRKALKARLFDGRSRYYELGGMQRKSIRWSVWCEQVARLLECKQPSLSSSCISTSYVVSSSVGCGCSWNQKNLWLGSSDLQLQPKPLALCQISLQQLIDDLQRNSSLKCICESSSTSCDTCRERRRRASSTDNSGAILNRADGKRCMDKRMLSLALKEILGRGGKHCRELLDFQLPDVSFNIGLNKDDRPSKRCQRVPSKR